jgi:hypothetical protein
MSIARNLTPLVLAFILVVTLDTGTAAGQIRSDTAFAALQERGETVMGVDQYTSTHRFDDLEDGGRIELRQQQAESAGVLAIRSHLSQIARAFAAGDFSAPGLVHARHVPGVETMAARHEAIHYEFRAIPGGGEIRITTQDLQALRAVHDFLRFQRTEHRAAGKEHEH